MLLVKQGYVQLVGIAVHRDYKPDIYFVQYETEQEQMDGQEWLAVHSFYTGLHFRRHSLPSCKKNKSLFTRYRNWDGCSGTTNNWKKYSFMLLVLRDPSLLIYNSRKLGSKCENQNIHTFSHPSEQSEQFLSARLHRARKNLNRLCFYLIPLRLLANSVILSVGPAMCIYTRKPRDQRKHCGLSSVFSPFLLFFLLSHTLLFFTIFSHVFFVFQFSY